jgi:tetratricopeptide (TPR) repeat protein
MRGEPGRRLTVVKLHSRASSLAAEGRFADAEVVARAALDMANDTGDVFWRARSLMSLGDVCFRLGAARGDSQSLARAIDCFGEAGALYRSMGHHDEHVALLQGAEVLRSAGEYRLAQRYFGDVLRRVEPLRTVRREGKERGWDRLLVRACLGLVDCCLHLDERSDAAGWLLHAEMLTFECYESAERDELLFEMAEVREQHLHDATGAAALRELARP